MSSGASQSPLQRKVQRVERQIRALAQTQMHRVDGRHRSRRRERVPLGPKCQYHLHHTSKSLLSIHHSIETVRDSVGFVLKEKWDIVTRKWKNSRAIIDSIKLFLIDEIHVLGESSRGAVIEAVISRMKTFASKSQSPIRFVAISATIPNIEDVF